MTYVVENIIPYFTGLPSDVAVNTFHFDWINPGDPTATDFGGLCDTVSSFYETVFPSGDVFMLNGSLLPNVTIQKVYDLREAKPRSPIYQRVDNMNVATDPAYTTPLEVALCLSYQAQKVSGQPQARRRGRIYLGPLGDLGGMATPGTPTTFPGPNNAWITKIKTAASALKAVVATTHFQWVVWSPTNGISAPILNGWVDNAWDTQRRRGNPPTARQTWT